MEKHAKLLGFNEQRRIFFSLLKPFKRFFAFLKPANLVPFCHSVNIALRFVYIKLKSC
jgi:hypothetical protein